MILRSVIATLLLTTSAWAAPVLKSSIVVNAPVVTVGDMFDAAGPAAEQALFRAPLPGTSGPVSLADVTAAMNRVGITEFSANGVTSVRVSRAATIIDESALAEVISDNLAERGILSAGMTANTVFAKPVAAINAEAVEHPVNVISLRYVPGNGTFSARFEIAGVAQPLDVTGSIELMIPAPHIRGNLASGTILTSDNVEMRAVPLRYVEGSGVVSFEDINGKALLRQSRDGMMLRATDVTIPLTVAKNDLVTIYFRKGPMTLTVRGQAVTGAANGGPVQVLNLMSKRVISATVIGTGAVEVGNGPLAVAGL